MSARAEFVERAARAQLRDARVIIVADNASTRFGGESILPFHYFRLLRRRGVDVRLVVHERNREELTHLLPQEVERICFVPDLLVQRWMWRASRFLPPRVADNTVGAASQALSAWMERKLVRELVKKYDVDVVHQPTPVSPKQPSFMFRVAAPVVIGPMNGGMDLPPGFAEGAGALERTVMSLGRSTSHLANKLIPGKRHALLLVANERTRRALPRGVSDEVVELVENGVDLTTFKPRARRDPRPGCRFVFAGRLVDWKRVDLLLQAFARLRAEGLSLHIVGDGPMRSALDTQVQALSLGDAVVFHGQLSQARCAELLAACDVMVLPSVRECGGAVVLEAMACGLPVIATNWGGPADYIDASTGVLVEPTTPRAFVDALSCAMQRLAESPALRARLGNAGLRRATRDFDWERKIDRILAIYAQVSPHDSAPQHAIELTGT
ncbi:MAG TPA: glycosyltransferase family 4 protein [Polyangiales bacterium]